MTSMRFFLAVMLAVLTTAADGPDRLWPVALGPAVSSSFCEYRDGRFHAGIDVRTYGREGVPCRAVADGWVSRVRASSLGYGKALHVTLADGEEAVYAHLAEFVPALEDSLLAAQRRAGRHNVDFTLPAGAFPVRRGDVIAYSGATGTAAPHLHFETRSGDVAVNPFLRGFAIHDRERPAFARVAFVPLDPASRVGGACHPLELRPRRDGPGRYALADTLRISGAVGVAASVIDRINSASGRLAPYEMQVWSDDSLVTRVVLEQFAFLDAGEVDLLYHAGANRARGVTLFELYRRVGEAVGGRTFVRGGRLTAEPGRIHRGRVVALDAAGNRAEVAFFFAADAGAPVARAGQPGGARAPNLAPDLDHAFFADGFAVLQISGARRRLRERGHGDGHGAPSDTLVLHARALVGRVRAIPDAAGADTAGVYVTGFAAGAAGSARFPALGLSLGVAADALYGGAVVFATRADTGHARPTPGLELRSAPVRVGPAGWVTRRGFDVHLDHAGAQPGDAVYRFDDRKRAWSFLASTRDSTGLVARSTRPGVFAVVRDTTPPWLGAPALAWPESYATGEPLPEIRVPAEDRGSGIDDGRILVTVGGVERYARWDFAKKKIVVALRGEPIIGPQPVHVVVFDKSGNQSVADATVVFESR
jgi:hypothetical protein